MHLFLSGHNFSTHWYIPRSVIAGLYGKSILSFVRNCETVSRTGWTILHSYQQWVRVLVPYTGQHLVLGFSSFQQVCNSISCLNVQFASDRCISSLVKCVFRSFAHFENWVVHFRIIEFCISWITTLYQMYLLQNFSPSLWFVFPFS